MLFLQDIFILTHKRSLLLRIKELKKIFFLIQIISRQKNLIFSFFFISTKISLYLLLTFKSLIKKKIKVNQI